MYTMMMERIQTKFIKFIHKNKTLRKRDKNMIGKLYVCPTPIGNLEDITIRTLNVLKEVDFIAAEDTRHTIKLLNHYEIKKPLISYHEHNEKSKSIHIIDRIIDGEDCGLVSDAGMPGISDPGEILIREAINHNICVIGLPGPSASILALVTSGLNTSKFVFEGFLSSKKSERVKRLKEIESEKRTIILYESPYRLTKTLNDMKNVLGNRNIVVSREMTKKFEEISRGNISEVIDIYTEKTPKGEIVIVVDGNKKEETIIYDISIVEHINQYMEKGYTKKEAVKLTAKDRKLPKNVVYKEVFEKK